jgi:hypothetical protein
MQPTENAHAQGRHGALCFGRVRESLNIIITIAQKTRVSECMPCSSRHFFVRTHVFSAYLCAHNYKIARRPPHTEETMSQGRVAMISALCELSRELFPRVGVSVILLSELITCKERWSLWPFAAAARRNKIYKWLYM